jgi:hypothetical protein
LTRRVLKGLSMAELQFAAGAKRMRVAHLDAG